MTTMQNVEIPRDRYGRPMVMQPNGKRVSYRRCTTFVGCLDDTYGLMQWKTRQVALGMGQRKDLVLAAAAADPADKKTLNDIADKATEHAQASAAATTGTALHSLTERVDLGQVLGYVPDEYRADIDAYQQATRHIEWAGIESFRVHDDWKIAGTADRMGRTPNGRLTIYDIKTGSVDFPHKMAMQLAMYARSLPYDIATDQRGSDVVNLTTGVIIHLPAGQGRCDLYEIDIDKGWDACLLAKQVWDWRGVKGLTRLTEEPPMMSTTWQGLAERADTVTDLRTIWQQAADAGDLTTELRQMLTRRSAELAA